VRAAGAPRGPKIPICQGQGGARREKALRSDAPQAAAAEGKALAEVGAAGEAHSASQLTQLSLCTEAFCYFSLCLLLFIISFFLFLSLLFAIYYFLFFYFSLCFLLFIISFLLFIISFLLFLSLRFAIYYFLFAIYYFLFAIYYFLFAIYYFHFAIYYLFAYCNAPKSHFEEKYKSHQASHNDHIKYGDKTATKRSILTWPIFQSETDEIQAQGFPTPLPLHWNKTEFLFSQGKNMKM